jgi:hypothetical protein
MKLRYLPLVMTLGLASGSALASSSGCAGIYDSLKQGSVTLAQAQTEYPECFAGSSPATAQQISATSFQQVTAISAGLGGRLLGGAAGPQQRAAFGIGGVSGMAAGGPADKWNAWGNVTQNSSRYDATYGANVRATSGNEVLNAVLGADYRLDGRTVVGVSTAFDRGTGTIGVANPIGTTTTGFAIAPYIGHQVSDRIALDASIGLGEGESSIGAARTDMSRSFLAGNATYAYWRGNWQLSGKAGVLWAQEKSSDIRNSGVVVANSSSTSRLGQVRVGVEAGYWYGNGIQPYVGVLYSADAERSVQGNAPWDRDAVLLTVGVNFFSLKDKITGGLAYTDETLRSHTRNSTLMGNVNIRF